MGRLPVLLIFIFVVLGVLLGLHYYLWLRLIRDPHWPSPWRAIATVALVLLTISLPATLFFMRRPASPLRLMVWPAFIWMGLMFLLTVILAGSDLIRLAAFVARWATKQPPLSAERRAFFAQWIAGGALTGAGVLGVLGMRSALGPVAVRRVEIALDRITSAHDGVTIAQLTDLHIGPTIGKGELADIVRRTNALSPDIVAITGDLVDGSVAELRDAVAPLADLKAKFGVYFVTGNHEYFSGVTEWVQEITRIGIRVLRNERITVGAGPSAFYLAGVDDRSAARNAVAGHGEDLPRALGARDAKLPLVLLAHQPRTVMDAANFDVDLQLSGHTHGGQIWPFGGLVRLQQRFVAGLSKHRNTAIYVSRGTGYWGPPMRLFAPAEITQIVLRAPATTT